MEQRSNSARPSPLRGKAWAPIPTSTTYTPISPVPADTSLIAAETEYGSRFAAAVQRGPIVATQFHPEKSQKAGMRLLENFLRDNGAL